MGFKQGERFSDNICSYMGYNEYMSATPVRTLAQHFIAVSASIVVSVPISYGKALEKWCGAEQSTSFRPRILASFVY
jgi:hypothetical protein